MIFFYYIGVLNTNNVVESYVHVPQGRELDLGMRRKRRRRRAAL